LNEGIPGVLEVRSCSHGKGVFALRDFSEGEVVAVVIGGEYTSRPKSTTGHALRIGDELYWDEAPPDSAAYWSNFLDHSGDPNCRFQDFNPLLPGANLVATRQISCGDEMFLNYRDYHPSNPTF
jgi:hypothetical protein